MAPANYIDLRNQNQVFEGVGSFGDFSMNLTGVGEPERLDARLVSANVFALLGVNLHWDEPFRRSRTSRVSIVSSC
jgi:hypothetical protein